MPATLTPWDYLEAYPPPYCRLLGKEIGGGPSDMSIPDAIVAIRADIPVVRIRQISQQENWDGVSDSEKRRIFAAINFDPTCATHRSRVRKYEKICAKRKSTPFHYLRRSPKWESEFLPLLLIVNRIMKSRSVSPTPTGASASLATS